MCLLQFLQDFLKICTIPPDVSLKDDVWKQLFGVVVQHFPTAQHQSFLLDFFKVLSQTYKESGRTVDFIIDLIFLGVNKLLYYG